MGRGRQREVKRKMYRDSNKDKNIERDIRKIAGIGERKTERNKDKK
jgi:hypothetical protein